MGKRLDVAERAQLFRELLEDNIGKDVPKKEFVVKADDAVTWRTCQSQLQAMQQKPWKPGFVLIVGQNSARLERSYQTVKDMRETLQPNIKSQLGALLWKTLFGIKFKVEQDALESTRAFERKLEKLRKKSVVTSLIDAGSTTQAVTQQLLDLKTLPVRIKDPSDPADRLISVRIVTNSPPLAELVCKSAHRQLIDVIVVGGTMRVERESICGVLSELCLRAWGFSGDIAIVGTTGYRDGGFACDDLEEAHLKSSFLEMATGLRILVFDSTKLASADVFKIFAPLSSSAVDLVVTDDGVKCHTKELVQEFRKAAKEAAVAVAVLRTKA